MMSLQRRTWVLLLLLFGCLSASAQSIDHCNSVSYYDDICYECANGYVYNAMGTCTNSSCPSLNNCQSCDGAGNCLTCPTHYVLNGSGGRAVCTPCLSNCRSCTLWNATTNSVNCTQCFENHYLQPQANSSGAVGCEACPKNQVSTGSTTQCMDCAHVTAHCTLCLNVDYCYGCELGFVPQYNVDTNSNDCVPCAPGTLAQSVDEGSYVLDVCQPCPAGTWSNGGNSTACTSCVENCIACSSFTSCDVCQAPYEPDPQTGACIPSCVPGTYLILQPSPMCFTCPNGYYTPSYHSTSCLPCSPGSYTNNDFVQSRCWPCPAGTYASASGQAQCTTCSNGYVTEDGTSCVPCAPGTLTCLSNTVAVSCNYGYGLYVTAATNASCGTSCLPCPTNTHNNVFGSSKQCTTCTGCGTCDSTSGDCRSCPDDTQYLDDRYWSCFPCNTNDYGCLTCASGTVCTECAPSFFLGQGSKCLSCSQAQSLGYPPC